MWYKIQTILLFTISLKSLADSCDCNKNHTSKFKGISKTNPAIGKRDLIDNEDYVSTEANLITTKPSVRKVKNSTMNVKKYVVIKSKSNKNIEKDVSETCPYYKTALKFDIEKMADVWQTAYYRMSDKVSCFKIHVRKTTGKERKKYLRKYGNFNNAVDWNSCFLEIKSGERQHASDRKHFLQGDGARGVFANIILDENEFKDNQSKIHLHEESADQWLVIKNLLLMRDCENGDVAVFSRVPHQPRLEDVWDALKVFREEAMNGTLACLDDDRVQRSIKNVLQEVLFRFRLF